MGVDIRRNTMVKTFRRETIFLTVTNMIKGIQT